VQIALTGSTAISSGQFWTVPGFQRIGRVGWEGRLGPADGGWLQPLPANAVSFAPTWISGGNWTRMAQNPGTVSGSFRTTFANPALVLCQVVWTVSGGSFTQNITITPDGVMLQTSASGFATGNWGLTFPILINDGQTSPATWGAVSTTNVITSGTGGIATCTWPSSGDIQNYMTISANPSAFTPETDCTTVVGTVRPVRAVVAADTTQTTFVYPAKSTDPTASTVRSTFAATGTNTYTCSALSSSVVSSSAAGTVYVGRTCAGGWTNSVVLSGGTVTFSAPCHFIAQLTSGHVTAIEVDRSVTATIQAHAPQALTAFTPVTGL
jgi:hypothetical protein